MTNENPIDIFSKSESKYQAPTITTTQTMLSPDQVKQIASQAVPGEIDEVELKTVNNQQVYGVDIENGDIEYEVLVDPFSGEIVKVIEESELGAQELELIQAKISQEQALALAQTQVSGTLLEVETEKENDQYLYDFEFLSNGQEVSVKIDMMTGAIVRIESEPYEPNDDDDEVIVDNTPIDITTGPITLSQAKQIALERVGGKVTDTDTKSRGTIYEIEIQKAGREYDVLVRKSDGRILDVESD